MLRWLLKAPQVGYFTISWALVILVLSAMPGRDLPRVDLLHADKLAHLVVYFVLFVLLSYWMHAKESQYSLLKAFLIASVFGVLMEFMQDTFFPERFFDWADAAANSLGALFGIVIIKLIDRTFAW
jgi:VanZ family protein